MLGVNTLADLGKPRWLGETSLVRIPNTYLRISLMLFIGLLVCACSPDFNRTRNPSTSSVDLELLIPAKLAQSVADDEGITAYVALHLLGGRAPRMCHWRSGSSPRFFCRVIC
ncbi:hypothetical protein OAF45_02525 [Candidatus Latescibacteria bacterium]|nr:hypothetical protein [Candidatus Latescibacterota bacterium]